MSLLHSFDWYGAATPLVMDQRISAPPKKCLAHSRLYESPVTPRPSPIVASCLHATDKRSPFYEPKAGTIHTLNGENGMTDHTFTFKYVGHTRRDDGLIGRYHLEVTGSTSGKTATISVEPRHLASVRSMKRILLDRCIFYRATRASHDQMLLKLFDK